MTTPVLTVPIPTPAAVDPAAPGSCRCLCRIYSRGASVDVFDTPLRGLEHATGRVVATAISIALGLVPVPVTDSALTAPGEPTS